MRLKVGAVVVLTLGLPSVIAGATSTLLSRSATDLCGDISGELVVPGPFDKKIPIGYVDKCICQSQIPELLRTDPLFIEAVFIAGETTVKNKVTDLLYAAKDRQKCVYPDNAEAVCTRGTPCDFQCANGFTPSPAWDPTECVCPAPRKVCNGVCGDYKACPSSKPWRRDTLRKRAACGKGLTACGIYGRTSSVRDAWECINTATDLESCGGCATPLDSFSARGVDCTAIQGAVDVSCIDSTCVVHRCAPGFEISDDDTFCYALGGMVEQSNIARRIRA